MAPVTLQGMLGLFIIPMATTAIAIGLALFNKSKLAQEVPGMRQVSDEADDPNELRPLNHNAGEGEMLRWLVRAEKLRQNAAKCTANTGGDGVKA